MSNNQNNIRLAEDEVLETSVIAGKKILKKVQRKKKTTDFVQEVEAVDEIVCSDLFANPNIEPDFSALYGKLPEDDTEDIHEIIIEEPDFSEDSSMIDSSVPEDVVDSSSGEKVRKRINTTKIFDNEDFINGGTYTEGTGRMSIAISPLVEEQYDYSVAEDIVLLNDRNDTTQIIYDIFMNAPFAPCYRDVETGIIKIPKDDIPRVFYYVKDRLLKRKKISAFETVIAINEFFEFNYDYIVKKVLSTPMMTEILNDYYVNLGMKDRIEDESVNPLF